MRTNITDFYGRVIGSIEDKPNEKIAYDFYGRVLGSYDKKLNITKNFYGKVIAKGDTTSALVWEKSKRK